jgi:hypothetical protein
MPKVTTSQEVVTPAKAGVQVLAERGKYWIPAFAGMTERLMLRLS